MHRYVSAGLFAPAVARGDYRTTKQDFPEPGISVMTCVPDGYAGGQFATNTIQSRQLLGPVSDPPGYTQPSIATVRLWRKR